MWMKNKEIYMSAIVVEGDILECDSKYIVHQCNCVSASASGLAGYLFNKYPYADVYSERIQGRYIHKAGEIYIRGNGEDQRYVINAMGQICPGPSKEKRATDFWHYIPDQPQHREQYFSSCLKQIAQIPELDSIAFPWKIGCGLAGGSWDRYKMVLDHFSNILNNRKTNKAKIIIIKREVDN